MSEAQINLHTEPGTIEDSLHGPLEEQLTSALRAAIDSLAEGAVGRPEADVYAELIQGVRDGLHPQIATHFDPDEAEMHRIARCLTDGVAP